MGSKSIEKLLHILKIIAPHIVILIAVGLYILIGGVVFLYLEDSADDTSYSNKTNLTMSSEAIDGDSTIPSVPGHGCSESELELIFNALYHGCCSASSQSTEECFTVLKEELLQCLNQIKTSYQIPPDPTFVPKQSTSEWNYSTAIILSFTIVTTIGYGHIAPRTKAGRMFCIFYGFVGIPLTLLAIADHGRFLSSGLQFLYVKFKSMLAKLRRKEFDQPPPMDAESLPPLLLLVVYCGYLIFGTLMLIKWEDAWTFADAFYFGFISLSTIGFGDLVPTNHSYLPLVLGYIGIGLILSSTVVDILAEYLKKLHEFGKKIRNVTHAKIWFGGKVLTVKDLVSTVGKYLGATEEALSHLVQNLDTVVNHAIIEHETGEAPEMLLPFHEPEKKVVEQCKPETSPPKQKSSPPKQKTPPPKQKVPERKKSYHQEADFIDDEDG